MHQYTCARETRTLEYYQIIIHCVAIIELFGETRGDETTTYRCNIAFVYDDRIVIDVNRVDTISVGKKNLMEIDTTRIARGLDGTIENVACRSVSRELVALRPRLQRRP